MKLKAMGIIGEYKIEDKYGCIEEDDESSSFKECQSDDSEDDPSFDPKKEVQSSMSRLSLMRKSKQRITKVTEEEGSEEAIDAVDIDVPELGEEDQKSFEAVQKKIEAGQVEKLKLDQCKVYLRKYGLRLTGNKEMLIRRIKEYLDVLNGGGERKHPVSSFVLNCKGDACTGDVVMFEQNVYEMFNIASRSANGHPCGTRIIAGRIVKESYGAVKQQHTFTIEVLWSKGVKPLPPLHPLLIKGRNLYRLKTMRQKWENEGERQKILAEKHSRGTLARSTREVRIQEREMRKMLKANRAPKLETLNRRKEENMADNPFQSLPISSGNFGTQPQEREKILHREQTSLFPSVHLAAERIVPRQHLASVTPSISFQNENRGQSMKSILPHHQFLRQHSTGMPLSSSTCHNQNHGDGMKLIHSQSQFKKPQSHEPNKNCNPLVVPSKRPLTNMNGVRQTSNSNSFQQRPNFVQNGNSFQNQCFEQQQLCKFYAQGRCYYGDRCKYLHEQKENH